MAFVVGSPCVGCKDTACVTVCPVDCFYEGPDMLYIDPDECIDCALCEPECPTDAIWADDELPAEPGFTPIPATEEEHTIAADKPYPSLTGALIYIVRTIVNLLSTKL